MASGHRAKLAVEQPAAVPRIEGVGVPSAAFVDQTAFIRTVRAGLSGEVVKQAIDAIGHRDFLARLLNDFRSFGSSLRSRVPRPGSNRGASGHVAHFRRGRRVNGSARRNMASPDGLDAYDRRELMPMRPCLRLAKLRCPATEAMLDVFDVTIVPVPEWPSAPRIHLELPRACPAARSAHLLFLWPLSSGRATIVPWPSAHDPHPPYRRACL